MSLKRFIDTVLHKDKTGDIVTAEMSTSVQKHECAVGHLAKALTQVFEGENPKALKVTNPPPR